MSFGTQDDADEVMNEINMTPLVDVMLVLLIIFIITVPVMKHAVNVDLPRAVNQPELHINGDKAVRYERVAQAMAAAQRAGVRKIGFITEPAP